MELAGKTFGIVGLGNIGRRVTEIALAFGMQVKALTSKSANTLPTGIKKADLEELLTTSDVISLHCPLTDATRHSVNRTPSSHLFEVVNVLFCQFIKFSTRLTFSHCRQSLGIWLIVERFMQKPLYQVVDTPMLPFCLGFQTL